MGKGYQYPSRIIPIERIQFRMIGGNQEKFDAVIAAHDYITSRPAFANVTFIPEKTGIPTHSKFLRTSILDWLIVHDFPLSAMENPGKNENEILDLDFRKSKHKSRTDNFKEGCW